MSKKLNISTSLEVYENLQELASEDFLLMEHAVKARSRAYAPYSEFAVGCAILLENNEIVTGNNQENAAYPSGLCAERVALFYAGSQYPGVPVKKMALTAGPMSSDFFKPVPPCGACRQVISEYEKRQENGIEIYFMGTGGKVVMASSMESLLPLSFDKNYL
ncbi:cytidine deaminase [Nonlabens sp. SCSIO 43208]|uniref:cytidine deaminase n=1 Tax=Nonlabens sp. SCSIO 43208 TaxID=2793009 RepID=UPI003D6A9B2C